MSKLSQALICLALLICVAYLIFENIELRQTASSYVAIIADAKKTEYHQVFPGNHVYVQNTADGFDVSGVTE